MRGDIRRRLPLRRGREGLAGLRREGVRSRSRNPESAADGHHRSAVLRFRQRELVPFFDMSSHLIVRVSISAEIRRFGRSGRGSPIACI